MNFEDTWSWPDIPVDEVDREDIETLYSFGHYDGPGTGLIRWNGRLWWAQRFTVGDERYWIVEISEDHSLRLLERGKEWARLFSSAMSWEPDGTRGPTVDGIYCTNLPFKYGDDAEYERRSAFYSEWGRSNKLEEPSKESRVVGYFQSWGK